MDDKPLSRGEKSRKAILDTAYTLFLEHGYAATSMRQIATRAGIALAGIYNHFGGKEAIFRELILARHPYHQILPIMLNTPADDPELFVRNAAQAMVDELGKRPDFIKLMMIELVEFNSGNMPAIVEQVLIQVMPLIEKFNHQALLKKMPPLIFFRAFLGLFFSYYMTEMMMAGIPAALDQDQPLDYFVEIFLHGVLAQKENA